MMQMVELHYRRPVACDFAAVKWRAGDILESELDSPDPAEAKGAFLIGHKQHRIEYSDGDAPAQTAILLTDRAPKVENYQQEIEQSWRCPNAKELLSESKSTILVTEMMASNLPPQDRVRLFHGVLRAMVEVTRPDALVCKHSQQVITAGDYLEACADEPIQRPGALNVRFYNISDSDGDMLMDTRGMQEIGLHDLQCHFQKLEPQAVARVLLNTALYVFENGAVIKSGQTVAGVQPDSKWRCQFENALVGPERELLDLNPGRPFAVGNRK